jgi:hypothetical protein
MRICSYNDPLCPLLTLRLALDGVRSRPGGDRNRPPSSSSSSTTSMLARLAAPVIAADLVVIANRPPSSSSTTSMPARSAAPAIAADLVTSRRTRPRACGRARPRRPDDQPPSSSSSSTRTGAGPRGSAPSPRRALGAPSAPRPPAGAEEVRRPSGRHGSASRRRADLRISPEARAEPAAGHRRRSGPCHRS